MHDHEMNLSMEANQIQGKHARNAWHAHEIRQVGKGAIHGHKGLAFGPYGPKVNKGGVKEKCAFLLLSLACGKSHTFSLFPSSLKG